MVLLLCFYVEANAAGRPFEIFQVALDICLGWLKGVCGLHKQFEKQCWLGATRDWPLLNRVDSASQWGRDDFVNAQDNLLGHFCNVFSSERASLYVYSGLHNQIFYHQSKKGLLADVLKMNTVSIFF